MSANTLAIIEKLQAEHTKSVEAHTAAIAFLARLEDSAWPRPPNRIYADSLVWDESDGSKAIMLPAGSALYVYPRGAKPRSIHGPINELIAELRKFQDEVFHAA